jgi:hypothetical protein
VQILRHLLKRSALLAAVLVALSFSTLPSAGNEWETRLVIQMHHYVGKEFLRLDSGSYKNELGQSFTVSKFKYYISDIRLHIKMGKVPGHKTTFLVDEAVSSSKQIVMHSLLPGTYSSLEFIIGVDSLHNCSGAQSGALDPVNAMFWAWNTGYIFLKLEGKAPVSKSPGSVFEYHIGGYRQPNNCIRKVHIDFKNDLVIRNNETTHIDLKADVLEILKSPSPIDFSVLSSVVDFHNSTLVADNYQDMFSLLKTYNEK